MKAYQTYDIPATQDPFVNTPLIHAGFDPDTGRERFWISTWNANAGCLGALITAEGDSRVYRFQKQPGSLAGCGAYSAVLEDNDTLWLCADLNRLGRLTLSTGAVEYFDTGATSALVFAGMRYDKPGGKLCAVAMVQNAGLCGFIFDIRARKSVKLFENFTAVTLSGGGFDNNDGTYALRGVTGRSCLLRWDPKTDTLAEDIPIHEQAECVNPIMDAQNRPYLPHMGWYDAAAGRFEREPCPQREMHWFARDGRSAYGTSATPEGAELCRWDFGDGAVTRLAFIPDGTIYGIARTRAGEFLSVGVYGRVTRLDSNGAVLSSWQLASDAVGAVDCLIRADEHRLLGTPFITQRFWLLDTRDNRGFDAGRAAPGGGEVLRVWKLGGRVYMASYTEGILTEYDPEKLLDFPDNPRIVAQAPHGMRPVAHADDGRRLYYACNHHYGILGCVLTRYDTAGGEALYRDDPMPGQHIVSLRWDAARGLLLAGTTYVSDCQAVAPSDDLCYVAAVSPDTLEVLARAAAPRGTVRAEILCEMDGGRYLALLHRNDGRPRFYVLHADSLALEEAAYAIPQGEYTQVKATSQPRRFLALRGDALEVWDTSGGAPKPALRFDCPEPPRHIFESDGYYYGVTEQRIYEFRETGAV